MSVAAAQRHTKAHPCRVCGGHDAAPRGEGRRCFGFISDDGEYEHCSREDLAGSIEQNANTSTFAHKLQGLCKCGQTHDVSVVQPSSNGSGQAKRKIVAIYPYTDEAGSPLFEVVRYQPKGFSQRHSDAKGSYVWNLEGVRRELYLLPEVVAAVTVFVVEGEKDCGSLKRWGFTATTCPMGSGKWRDEYSKYLEGKHVIIIPDGDDPGRRHAIQVGRSLLSVAANLNVIELDDAMDITAWFELGHTGPELSELIEAAQPITEVSLREFELRWFPARETSQGAEAQPVAATLMPVDGAALMRDLELFIRRFVVLPEHTHLVLAVWTAATYCFELFDAFAYLLATSPAPRCGKTRLLEIVELIAHAPTRTANISEAALFRHIADKRPTLLLDEMEGLNSHRSERAEALRGLINAGNRRGATAIRCQGQKSEAVEFHVFCPKVVAGIGEFPATIRDRSICIPMQRRTAGEPVERLKLSRVEPEAEALRVRVKLWVEQNEDSIAAAYQEVNLPFLDDRAEDSWSSLFAVLSVADAPQLDRLQADAVALSDARSETEDEQTLAVRLLADIRDVIDHPEQEIITSKDLLMRLRRADGTPWFVEDEHTRPEQHLSTRRIARLLRPFGVRPANKRLGGKVPKGYSLSELERAFARYLSKISATSATTHTFQCAAEKINPLHDLSVAD